MIRLSDTSDVFSPEPGDVIFLRVSGQAEDGEVAQRVEELRRTLDALGHLEVGIIVLSDFEDVRLLKESDLRKLGWRRIR